MPVEYRSRRLRTSYSLAACLIVGWLPSVSQERTPSPDRPEAVRLRGVVSYDGRIPDPIPVIEAGTSRQLIEVDPATKGLKDVVVWLEGVPDSGRDDGKPVDEPVVMDQQDYFFVPHVLAVSSGQDVEFRNGDGANHGVRASSTEPRNEFNVTTPPGGRYAHRFVASKHPVAVGCPIHAAMAGWVYVFAHRFHAVTDARGVFSLPQVPPGRYTLRVQHADGGLKKSEPILVSPDKPGPLRIEFHDADRKGGK